MFMMVIDIDADQQGHVRINEGDDLSELAQAFVHAHGLSEGDVSVVTQLLQDHVDDFLAANQGDQTGDSAEE